MRERRVSRIGAVAVLLLPLLVQPAAAQQTNEALEVDELLASSVRHYPAILASLAARRGAEGRALEAAGAFDIVFEADGFGWLDGFYDGRAVSGTVKRRLRPLGTSLYAGYKLSDGTLPIYEDVHFTNTGGTARLGVLFSLMRDRDIDDERFAERDARLAIRAAELDLLLTQIGVQQRALVAYWRWVAFGRQLDVYRALLRNAIERQDAFEEQIRRGARAQIFLTENLQNTTRRRILVRGTERDLAMAANALSLYYRDEDGRPRVPSALQLPSDTSVEDVDANAVNARAALSEALANRPELALLRTAIERELNRIALNENALKPELDLGVEVQSGLGAIAEGGPSRDTTDTVVGFTFSVPLEQREQRGKLEQSRAKLDVARAEQQARQEEIELEVRNLLLDLGAARELLELAAQQVRQTEAMRAAEQRRFDGGASDFFLVNLREESAADAEIRFHEAELSMRIARANYDAATVDLERLGISAPDRNDH